MQKQAFHIPSLDGIRCLAFLIVFLSHAGLEKIVPGGFGVTIFFFLSGYLITTLLRREHEQHGSISLRGFYQRRMLRILPAFYLVLALASLATIAGWLPGTIQAMPLAARVFHFANYWMIYFGNEGMPAGTGVYWSLAVEEHFYLIFPLIYVGMLALGLRARTQAALLLAGCVVVMLWRFYLAGETNAEEIRISFATDTRFDSILFGCALAAGWNPVMDRMGSDRLWKFVLLPAGLALLAFSLGYRSEFFRETFRYTLQGIALVPVFVVAIRNPDLGFLHLLNLRWISYFGMLTYPMYLVHFMVLLAIRKALPESHMIVQGTVAFVISAGLSVAIHRGVEEPVSRWKARQ